MADQELPPVNQPNPQQGGNTQQIISDIKGKIGATHTGTYDEGKFYTGISELENLKTQLDSGKLSQSDYVTILDQVLPPIKDGLTKMGNAGQTIGGSIESLLPKLDSLDQNYNLLKQGRTFLGRDLTAGEIAQAAPSFQGPNGLTNGNAYLANLAQTYKSNPGLDPGSSMNTQKPQDIQGAVTQQFQSILGRAPTQDELQHFTQAIQSNQTDAYGLGSFLKQQPEYTNAQDKNFRGSLSDELQGYDQKAFGRMKNDVISDYASRGFTPGSSPSLDYALTDLMGKIAENRGNYLAGLSAQQYGGNKDLAVGNYQNTLGQMYNQQQANSSMNSKYGQQLLNQGFQGADYQTQMKDYMNALNSQQQGYKPNAFDYLNTGANLARGAGSLIGAFG